MAYKKLVAPRPRGLDEIYRPLALLSLIQLSILVLLLVSIYDPHSSIEHPWIQLKQLKITREYPMVSSRQSLAIRRRGAYSDYSASAALQVNKLSRLGDWRVGTIESSMLLTASSLPNLWSSWSVDRLLTFHPLTIRGKLAWLIPMIWWTVSCSSSL